MKKVFLGLLAALMLTVPAFAHPLITVYVDGEQLSFDQPPIIQDDRTLVPMRKIFEALDAQVIWDEADQTVMAMHNEDIIMLQIGEAGLYKNGELVYTMSVPAQIINDRTLVPLRAVAEALGYTVTWNQDAQTAVVYNGPRSAVCTINSNEYGKQRMRIKLQNKAELIDGVTMVPVEMLDYVMGYSVKVSAAHI